jgi:predicted 3-demethylubiquinone-9 3-methyltransferase (glyoxalase superfamily)
MITGFTTFLWCNGNAAQAADFYVDTFPNSRVTSIEHYPADAHLPAGSVLTVAFELFGQPFVALNGGDEFAHTPAISFQVFCETQDEIDELWDRLTSNGGSPGQCGWCTDQFGVSWQVVPTTLSERLGHPDPLIAQRAFQAMLQMTKFIISDLG